MSRSLNIAVHVGNLTRDVELRTTKSGKSVATVSIAVNDREKGPDGEWTDYANYFTWTVWGATAENCAQYLRKGSPVTFEGRARWRQWETDDGQKRSVVEFIAHNVIFPPKSQSDSTAPRHSDQGRAASPKEQLAAAGIPVVEDHDDIPF